MHVRSAIPEDTAVRAQPAAFYEKAPRPSGLCRGAPNAFTQAAGYSAAELEALPVDAALLEETIAAISGRVHSLKNSAARPT